MEKSLGLQVKRALRKSGLRPPNLNEIKEVITSNGYHVTQDYNLIMKSPESEYCIGTIRTSFDNFLYHPAKVVVSYSVPKNPEMREKVEEEARGLIKLLEEEGIHPRNLTPLPSRSNSFNPNKYYRTIS